MFYHFYSSKKICRWAILTSAFFTLAACGSQQTTEQSGRVAPSTSHSNQQSSTNSEYENKHIDDSSQPPQKKLENPSVPFIPTVEKNILAGTGKHTQIESVFTEYPEPTSVNVSQNVNGLAESNAIDSQNKPVEEQTIAKEKSGELIPVIMEDKTMLDIQPPNPRILFYGLDQKNLNSEQQTMVEHHAGFLSVHPDYSIQIHGHTDEQGATAYNKDLALQRAQVIADHLISSGVDPKQIEVFGWGSADPLLSISQHDKNRRVELIYLSNQLTLSQPENTIPKHEHLPEEVELLH